MPNWFEAKGLYPLCGTSAWSFQVVQLEDDLYAVTYQGDLSLENSETLRKRIRAINKGERRELGGPTLGRDRGEKSH